MILGLRSVCSACFSNERKFPSQFRRKLKAALKSVGVLSASGRPSGVTSRTLPLAPFVRISWHDQQERVLSCDRRRSLNNRSPSARRTESWAGMTGIGVIGSPPAGARRVGDCASAGEAALKQTSASRRHAVRQPGARKVAADGTGAGTPWHELDIVERPWPARERRSPSERPRGGGRSRPATHDPKLFR